MSARARKFVGMLALLAFMVLWIWAAVSLSVFVPTFWPFQLIYYVVVGTGWFVPMVPLVKWMNRGK